MTFWSAFSSSSADSPLDVRLCRGCFDVMWNASVSGSSSKKTEALDPAPICAQFNALAACPVRFSMIEQERSVRRSPYTDDEISRATTAPPANTSRSCCDACLGALQRIDDSTLLLATTIAKSPFKDSNEISFCCTVPPSLCLWWDAILGLFIECVHRCCRNDFAVPQLSQKLKGNTFVVASGPADNNSSGGSGGGGGDYSWRGNFREDHVGGGLRGALVAEMRIAGLQCLPPPQRTPAEGWRYVSQGAGHGLVAQVLFHNKDVWIPMSLPSGTQLAMSVMSGNFGPAAGCLASRLDSSETGGGGVDPGLLQHDASDLQWTRIISEIVPIVALRLRRKNNNNNNTVCSIGLHHEPLFLYGRYRKFSRTMSQSPWFANGGVRIGRELSLQEEITNRLLHIFFPGHDLEKLNAEAALHDSRLVVPSRHVKTNNNDNGDNKKGGGGGGGVGGGGGGGQQKSPFLRKHEVQQARREAAAEASATSSAPQRRDRNDKTPQDPEEQQEAQEQQQNDQQQPQQQLADPFRFVSAHVRPMFENVKGFCLYRFHAGGREDVDVRMLGNGRPFVVEVLSPHRQCFSDAELAEVARQVSESSECVEVDSLQVVPRTIMADLQKDAEAKRKAYRCVCYCQRALRADDPVFAHIQTQLPITLKQKTPTRVLHRRSSMTRDKKIYSIEFELLNPHWLVVDLVTQAGTYVKEFCHGDMGRTLPNLGTLLESDFADIIQLDVKQLFSTLGGGDDAAGDDDDDDVDE